VAPDRVWYVPNFVAASPVTPDAPALPGVPGSRIACVANLRAQKNHLDLLRAFALTVRDIPDAHLLLIGGEVEPLYAQAVRQGIADLGLGAHVTLLGERRDVAAILRQCDVGVLSSVSEGFPLALVEYGLAGLATVTTDVGQCAEVVDGGRAGLLINPGDSVAFGALMSHLLATPQLRTSLGDRLRRRVLERYGAEAIVRQVCLVYDRVRRSSRSPLASSIQPVHLNPPPAHTRETREN
jgi:glycosyltransferase involved in cell wall biosynthesis